MRRILVAVATLTLLTACTPEQITTLGIVDPATVQVLTDLPDVRVPLRDGTTLELDGTVTAIEGADRLGVAEEDSPQRADEIGSGADVARRALLNVGATQSEADFGVKVCLRESHCNLNAHNYNPRTGDDSYGPWQINYYGSLRGRASTIGPPESNRSTWSSAASNFLQLLRAGGRCHWQKPYCGG